MGLYYLLKQSADRKEGMPESKRLYLAVVLHARIRGAPEPSREIFVYRVHKETSEEDMRDFMDSNGFDVRAIECTSKPDSLFKSFHVTIPLSQVEKAFDPQLWPEGVWMRKYWPIRKVAESDKH